jgi:hypothetical protein
METHRVRVATLVALVLLAPAWARAQVVPSPPWGEPIQDGSVRFVVLASYNGEAVYDQETGLVWEQSPITVPQPWAPGTCNDKVVGNRKGWRVPTVQELASLLDPSLPFGPTLPAGHPFSNVHSWAYWSATAAPDPRFAWNVQFNNAVVILEARLTSRYYWCVRGGHGADAQ